MYIHGMNPLSAAIARQPATELPAALPSPNRYLLHAVEPPSPPSPNPSPTHVAEGSAAPTDTGLATEPNQPADEELRQAFHDFVGQTFFGELIKSYRSTQQPLAYFHGGRAEQIFQAQLDQVLAEALSERSADKIADPMFELFMMKRQG